MNQFITRQNMIAIILFIFVSGVYSSATMAQHEGHDMPGMAKPKRIPAKKPAPKKSSTANSNTSNATNAAADERTYWESIRNSTYQADFRAYLKEYPNGKSGFA